MVTSTRTETSRLRHLDAEPNLVPVCGCAPLYKIAAKQWTVRLKVQMTLYVVFVGVSMAMGGLLPWMLEGFHQGSSISNMNPSQKLFSTDVGYVYKTNNSYSFCPNYRIVHYEPVQRGFPAPPLDFKDGAIQDAWYHKPVQLRGISWFGFNNLQGGVDGLYAGGSAAATDLQAIVYQLKLLGFNAIRLPFTFDMLQRPGHNQAVKCMVTTKSAWAKRATDPQLDPQPEYASVPDPPVYLHTNASVDLCNTYLPSSNSVGLERLLWMVQYLVASGFYVVLDYHPTLDDPTALNIQKFAESWLVLWAAVTCLPNFSTDIRGRILLDLLNDPGSIGPHGISWNRISDVPGLDQLYLSTMDSIEHITPGEAVFLLQGSSMINKSNTLGLSSGDGFVTDQALIDYYALPDPRPFFDQLLTRNYRGRVMLAPHLYGPDNSKVPAATPEQLLSRFNSSWGTLALNGYCNAANNCLRLPVIAGELGSQLDSPGELTYYDTVAALATAVPAGSNRAVPVLSGWIWWAYNANSNGTGGLVTDDWQHFLWPKVRFLVDKLGLRPWYTNPEAFVKNLAADQAEALRAQALADAATEAKTAAVEAVNSTGEAGTESMSTGSSVNLTDLARLLERNSSTASGSSSVDAAPLTLDVPAEVELIPDVDANPDLDVPAVVEALSDTEAEAHVLAAVDFLEWSQPSLSPLATSAASAALPVTGG